MRERSIVAECDDLACAARRVPDVEVTVVKSQTSSRTDTAGRFFLSGFPQVGSTSAFAGSPTTRCSSITVPSDDTTDVEVTLGVTALQLTGMVVQEHAAHSALGRVRDTTKSGHRTLRDAQRNREAASVAAQRHDANDSRRHVVTVETVVVLRFARAGRGNCPPQFFVDGIQAYGFSIDDMPPGDVEGVEFYAGAAGLPPEFNRMRGQTICGTVAIWTRIPGGDDTKP